MLIFCQQQGRVFIKCTKTATSACLS